ncbi:unnamed protein product, partial [Amoebophrya sp. A25]
SESGPTTSSTLGRGAREDDATRTSKSVEQTEQSQRPVVAPSKPSDNHFIRPVSGVRTKSSVPVP